VSPRKLVASGQHDDATDTMELLALQIGQLSGAVEAGRLQRLRSYLLEVAAGRAVSPIGLFLSVAETLEFLDVIEAASKVAIRLHDLAMSREGPPVENTKGPRG
jgi:hypothetical protein